MPNTTQKRRICIVVASRANYARIKSVMQAVKDRPDLELQLIVSASALLHRFGRAIDVIRADGFEPDATVYIIIEGENPATMAKSTGLAIVELSTVFNNLKPDIVLTVADRFETMATAIAASYMNIPVAHTQGGEITGSIDESVRHAVTKLSHIHFPATEESAERLVKMGEAPETVFLTGCPAIDAVTNIDLRLDGIFERYGGVGAPVSTDEPYLLVMQHPVTTEYGSGLNQINATLKALLRLDMQTIMLWPNVDAGSDHISKGMRIFREKNRDKHKIHFYTNFSVEDYARIMANAACIVGNSSSALREGAFLGVPAVNIGTRQQGRERGHNVIDVDYDTEQIVTVIRRQIAHGQYESDPRFGRGDAGPQIADILATVPLSVQKRLAY